MGKTKLNPFLSTYQVLGESPKVEGRLMLNPCVCKCVCNFYLTVLT